MQVVQMQKQKKWRARIALHPARRGFRHPGSRPLAFHCAARGFVVNIKRAIVDIEAPVQSKTPVQNEAAHERAGPVSCILQDSGKRNRG